MPDNVVATFVSALVGGEVRGRVVICATIILEGLNVSKANLQLESMCDTVAAIWREKNVDPYYLETKKCS